jgi:hypothetical protein
MPCPPVGSVAPTAQADTRTAELLLALTADALLAYGEALHGHEGTSPLTRGRWPDEEAPPCKPTT